MNMIATSFRNLTPVYLRSLRSLLMQVLKPPSKIYLLSLFACCAPSVREALAIEDGSRTWVTSGRISHAD